MEARLKALLSAAASDIRGSDYLGAEDLPLLAGALLSHYYNGTEHRQIIDSLLPFEIKPPANGEPDSVLKGLIPKEAAFALAPIYERLIDSGDKRSKGQYYTSSALLSLMSKKAFAERPLYERAVLDPALGCAVFLVEYVSIAVDEALNIQDEHERLKVLNSILSNLHAYEINRLPFLLSKAALYIALSPLIKSLPAKRLDTELLDLPGIKNEDYLLSSAKGKYDIAIFNPPYLGEKGNKALFDRTMKANPKLKEHYLAKMDYFYWFVIKAIEELKEGGRICLLSSPYWYSAVGAAKLRSFIVGNMYDLTAADVEGGAQFKYALGIHSTVFTAMKGGGDAGVFNYELYSQNERRLEPVKRFRAEAPSSDGRAWSFYNPDFRFYSSRKTKTFDELLSVKQGLVPNPQHITERHLREFPDKGYSIKEPIFVFPKGAAENPQLSGVWKSPYLRGLVKNSDISAYYINPQNSFEILYLDKHAELNESDTIYRYLKRFKPILEKRRECAEGKLPWYALHWARDENLFRQPSIVCPYHSKEPVFAYGRGGLYAAADIYFIHPRAAEDEELFLFYLAVLNSESFRQIFDDRGRRKGAMRLLVSNSLKPVPLPDPELADYAAFERVVELSRQICKTADENAGCLDGAAELIKGLDAELKGLYTE